MATGILTSGGSAYIADALAGQALAVAPSYIVFGSGQTPISRFMSNVPGETFRSPIAAIDRSGYQNVSSVVYHAFLADHDNVGQSVYCYGVVGGAATAAANTGTLIVIANEPNPFGKDLVTTVSVDIQLAVSGVMF